MKKLLQSLFVFLFFASTAMAQNRTITGTVTSSEDNLPIPGVSVKVKGTQTGTVTDANGKYSVRVDGSKELEFNFIGFTSVTKLIGSTNIINVALENDTKALQEVVVVGYGTQSTKTITNSIARISGDAIKDQPVPNVAQALQGRLAGVQVTSGGGRPGSPIQINVRGRSSILAGNDPLYVIDGVILPSNSGTTPVSAGAGISPLANLNSEDIASIEVLKDASAAAIYGSRGSNGVVLITTKKGSASGKSIINLNAYNGYQSFAGTKHFLDASSYRQMYNEALINAKQAPKFTQAQIDNPEANVNWLDAIQRDKSLVQNVQLSVASGGNAKTQFYTSLNYFNQDSKLLNGSFKRYAIRLSVDHQVNDFIKIGSNIAISKSDRAETPVDNSIFSPFPRALIARPDQPIYNANGTFASNDFNNPVHMFESKNYIGLSNVFNSTYAEVKILPELKFKSSVGIDYTYLDQRTFNPSTSLSGIGTVGSAVSGYYQTQNYLTTQTLSYLKKFIDNKLTVDGTLVYEFQWNNRDNNRVDGQNFPSNDTPYLTSAAKITGGTSSFTNYRMESYLGRVNLAWENKYLLGGSIRRDGSTKFPAKGRIGYFPSVSGGWVVSEEPFMKDVAVISNLKIRSSYGLTGNQEGIGNFSNRRLFGTGFNYDDQPGFALNAIGSPDLKWESTRQFDLGLDLALFKNRLTISADYYHKTTKDILQNRPIPSTTGFSTILENVGSMVGKGWDFNINSENLVGEVKWNTSFNISTYKNKVTELYNNQGLAGSFVTRSEVGQPLGSFFVIKALGVNPSTGDMMYEDLNKDGLINGDDRQFLASPLPKFYGGLNNTVSYKGIDLGVMFQYSYGNYLYNLSAEGTGGYESLGAAAGGSGIATNISQEAFDGRWTPSNPNAEYPRAIAGAVGGTNTQRSSRYLEDASYIRLKNITLGYSLPGSFLNKIKLSSVRVYVSGQNLLTFTKYKGFDPEVSSEFTVENTGVDQGAIPQFKTVMFGINVGL
ncbi:TonB-dependent receptor [Pedobacter sp. PF22-3]|uniref:SusC/RagA family TonB-linked outer membrane protein n=1 Tax=Pedobacter sp. PF22-3 TaxID=2994467 RepID=UPI0022465409|nr:TonB-dependent receptor [Pedobacter sp. PF22-3]MCX2493491.1 TonB-dependent receptor [Pedobacter sp. PF22-3]